MMRLTVLSILLLSACLLPMGRGDLAAANAQNVQRMCTDQNYAYESGYNTGLKRKPLDTSWVSYSCAPEWQAPVRTAYQTGYQTGIQNAPVVVPLGRYAAASRCTFSSDCGEGRTCRSNECMGGGMVGDACWFSSDCLSDSCDISAKVCR